MGRFTNALHYARHRYFRTRLPHVPRVTDSSALKTAHVRSVKSHQLRAWSGVGRVGAWGGFRGGRGAIIASIRACTKNMNRFKAFEIMFYDGTCLLVWSGLAMLASLASRVVHAQAISTHCPQPCIRNLIKWNLLSKSSSFDGTSLLVWFGLDNVCWLGYACWLDVPKAFQYIATMHRHHASCCIISGVSFGVVGGGAMIAFIRAYKKNKRLQDFQLMFYDGTRLLVWFGSGYAC